MVALDRKIGILEADIPNFERIIAKINGEYPGLSYALQEAQSIPCPICEVPVDRVLASKCELSHKLPDVEAADNGWKETGRSYAKKPSALTRRSAS